MKNKVLPILLVLSILVLTACSEGVGKVAEDIKNLSETVEQAEAQETYEPVEATPEPTAEPAIAPTAHPTETPKPTDTPHPAPTPTNTPTPQPTTTPTPKPTVEPTLLPSVEPVKTPIPSSKPEETESPKSEDTAVPDKLTIEFLAEVENKVVELCNIERAKAGLGPLEMNSTLREIARFKSKEMGEHQYFAHESKVTGDHCWDLAKQHGYTYTAIGENIWNMYYSTQDPSYMAKFKAKVTADRIVSDWMDSEGHRKNILRSDYNKIGVGVVVCSNLKAYATQVFSD
jgi:uncharacterized protein YkwD